MQPRDFHEKCRQQQNFDSDPKEAWHYNHVTFTPIAKHFMLYCRLIYMLSMLYFRLTIKVKVRIPESFKVGWYPHKITGSSHLKFYIILSCKTLLNYCVMTKIELYFISRFHGSRDLVISGYAVALMCGQSRIR